MAKLEEYLVPGTAAKFFLEHSSEILPGDDQELKRSTLAALERFEFSAEEREQAELQLKDTVDREVNDPALLEEALFALASLQREFEPSVWSGWLDQEQLPVRVGVLAGLTKFHNAKSALFTMPYLERMEESTIPAERAAVAEIIGRAGNPVLYGAVKRLLDDPDPSVQQAAFSAAARLGHAELIEPLLARYVAPSASPEILRVIERSLASFGSEVFPHLEKRIERGDVQGTRLHRLTRLLGTWCRLPSDSENADGDLKQRSIAMLTQFLDWHCHGISGASTSGGSLRLAAFRELVASEVVLDSGTFVDELLRDAQWRPGTSVRKNSTNGTCAFAFVSNQ